MRAINIDDLRAAAKRRLPRAIFEFIDGGAQDESTLRANREDFQKWRFRTRTLTDVSTRDQSITLFGQRYASPLILAPTGLASGGQTGVERALEILRDEIDITLTLLGRPCLSELGRSALMR